MIQIAVFIICWVIVIKGIADWDGIKSCDGDCKHCPFPPCKKKPTGLLNSTDELRTLLIEHPDLPLLVFAGEDCNSGDYSYMSCSHVSASIGEYLDCMQTVNDERCYTDRDDFQEDMEDCYSDFDGSDKEFEIFIENKLLEYEPYWKPCIIVYVDN